MGYIADRILIGLLLCSLIGVSLAIGIMFQHKIVSGILAIFTGYFVFMFIAMILFSRRPNTYYYIY